MMMMRENLGGKWLRGRGKYTISRGNLLGCYSEFRKSRSAKGMPYNANKNMAKSDRSLRCDLTFFRKKRVKSHLKDLRQSTWFIFTIKAITSIFTLEFEI